MEILYDIDYKKVKKGYFFYLIFFLVGILLLGVFMTIVFVGKTYERSLDVSTKATKIEIIQSGTDNPMYSPTYHYEVDGVSYICESTANSSVKQKINEGVVYYDSTNPERCLTDYSKEASKVFLVFLVLPIIFISIGLTGFMLIMKKIKRMKYLNQYGKLIKNLPYRLENSNLTVNGRRLLRIVIDYVLPNGEKVIFKGEPIYGNNFQDSNNTADLLIDENNPKNYFVDFEINRIMGNRKEDYYNDPNIEKKL